MKPVIADGYLSFAGTTIMRVSKYLTPVQAAQFRPVTLFSV
jgi:hypothetical protein